MVMQVHFQVADIPEHFTVHKHTNEIDNTDIGGDIYMDTYIVVDPASMFFSTDAKHERAWRDCGACSESQMQMIQWLIENRIPFAVS